MAPNLDCNNCLKSFRNEGMLKTHRRMNSCRKKTFEDMEKENENLEAAIVIEDDEEEMSITLEENSVSLEQLKKQSAAMVDQVESYLATEGSERSQSELTLSDKNFKELSSKLNTVAKPLSTSPHPPPTSQFNFKRPQMALPLKKTMVRKKAVVGMLTGRACSYCSLEQPDFTSLAFHYVREHWEEVREKHSKQFEGSGGRPRSKFHLSGTSGMQEEAVQMTMPTKANKPNQDLGPRAGPYKPYNKSGPDAAWMRKLEEKNRAMAYNEKMRRYREMSAWSNANRKKLAIRPGQPACQICQVVFKTQRDAIQHNMAKHGNKSKGNTQPQQKMPKLTSVDGGKNFVDPTWTSDANMADSCEVCDDEFSWPEADHSCPRTDKAKKNPVSKPISATPTTIDVDENVTKDPILNNDLVLVVD